MLIWSQRRDHTFCLCSGSTLKVSSAVPSMLFINLPDCIDVLLILVSIFKDLVLILIRQYMFFKFRLMSFAYAPLAVVI